MHPVLGGTKKWSTSYASYREKGNHGAKTRREEKVGMVFQGEQVWSAYLQTLSITALRGHSSGAIAGQLQRCGAYRGAPSPEQSPNLMLRCLHQDLAAR